MDRTALVGARVALGRALLASASGALMWCAFSPLNIWWLVWVAPGCLMWLCSTVKRPRQAMLYAALHAVTLYGLGIEWMRAIDDGPYIGLVLLETSLFAIWGIIVGNVLPFVRLPWRAFAFAASWVCFEWARSTGTYAFPWFLTATVFAHPPALPWLQLASITGGWGVSGAAVCISGLAVQGLVTRKWKVIGFAGLILVLQGATGAWDLLLWTTKTLDSDYAGRSYGLLVQGAEDRGIDRAGAFSIYAKLTAERIAALNKEYGTGPDPASPETPGIETKNPRVVDFVLWPEGAVQITERDLPAFTNLSKAWNTSLITGLGEQFNNGSVGNVIRVFTPDGRIQAPYAKRQLVPFGEFFPLRHYLDPLFERYGVNYPNYTPGTRIGVSAVGDLRLGMGICYETAFGYIARDNVLAGATVLSYVTSDQTYDKTIEQKQHFDIASVRAVEVRRPMLRASSTGLTGIVQPSGLVAASPYGRSKALLNAGKPGVLDVVVDPITVITLYTRLGDWFVWCCWAFSMITVGLAIRRRRSEKRPATATATMSLPL